MVGERTVIQEALSYERSLQRQVPAGHLARAIDLSGIRAHLRSFYSEAGRPSIDTERRIQMLVVGYRSGIRCEPRLCKEGI